MGFEGQALEPAQDWSGQAKELGEIQWNGSANDPRQTEMEGYKLPNHFNDLGQLLLLQRPQASETVANGHREPEANIPSPWWGSLDPMSHCRRDGCSPPEADTSSSKAISSGAEGGKAAEAEQGEHPYMHVTCLMRHKDTSNKIKHVRLLGAGSENFLLRHSPNLIKHSNKSVANLLSRVSHSHNIKQTESDEICVHVPFSYSPTCTNTYKHFSPVDFRPQERIGTISGIMCPSKNYFSISRTSPDL